MKNRSTYVALINIAQLGINQAIQQPVNRFIVVEHLEELDQPGELCALEHFTCEQRSIVITWGKFWIFVLSNGACKLVCM